MTDIKDHVIVQQLLLYSKVFEEAGFTGEGEANYGENVGTEGTGVYEGKNLLALQFRKLVSKNSAMTLSYNSANKTLEFTVNAANINHQALNGAGINSHATIDSHIADTTGNPHGVTMDTLDSRPMAFAGSEALFVAALQDPLVSTVMVSKPLVLTGSNVLDLATVRKDVFGASIQIDQLLSINNGNAYFANEVFLNTGSIGSISDTGFVFVANLNVLATGNGIGVNVSYEKLALDTGATVVDQGRVGFWSNTNPGSYVWNITVDQNALNKVTHNIDTTAGPVMLTLPNPGGQGFSAVITKETDISTPPVRITTSGGTALIGAETEQVIYGESEGITVISDGVAYHIIQDSRGRVQSKLSRSSGIISGMVVTQASSTTVDISAGIFAIEDPTDLEDPVSKILQYPGVIGLAVTGLSTPGFTVLRVDSTGAIIQEINGQLTAEGFRLRPRVGTALHFQGTGVMDSVYGGQTPLQNPGSRLSTHMAALGANKNGLTMSANGANLRIDVSSGVICSPGINTSGTKNVDPDCATLGALVPVPTFIPLTRTLAYAPVANVIVASYNPTGDTVAAISGGPTESAIHRVFRAYSGEVLIQYGQNTYATLTDALDSLVKGQDAFTPNPLTQGITIQIGYIIAKRTTTSLANTADVIFLGTDRFGDAVTGGTAAQVVTLQRAYENSVQPQITTDATRGPLQVKGGVVGANVFEFLRNTNDMFMRVTEDGKTALGVGVSGLTLTNLLRFNLFIGNEAAGGIRFFETDSYWMDLVYDGIGSGVANEILIRGEGGEKLQRFKRDGSLWLPQLTTTPTLESGFGGFYIKSTDGLPYYKSGAGTEYGPLTGGGSAKKQLALAYSDGGVLGTGYAINPPGDSTMGTAVGQYFPANFKIAGATASMGFINIAIGGNVTFTFYAFPVGSASPFTAGGATLLTSLVIPVVSGARYNEVGRVGGLSITPAAGRSVFCVCTSIPGSSSVSDVNINLIIEEV